ncbi:MAG TPA: restriction endonuclease subunit S [Phycisphaerae bacterium]|nr:restriction endonuclease subunit S [Phycisphaerae bacterium]
MASEWPDTPLGEVCEVNPDKRDSSWSHELVEYIDITSVGSGVTNEPPKLIPLHEAPSRAQRLVRPGDTIVSTVRPNRRSFLYLREPAANTVVSTGFAVLRAKKGLQPRFLFYLVSDQAFTDYLVSHEKGSAYPAVNANVFSVAEVSLPPLAEQRAIAAVLGALDDRIELNRKSARVLEGIARSVFTSWFVDFDPVRYNIKREGEERAYERMGRAARFGSFGEDISIIDKDGRSRPLRSEDIHRHVAHLFPNRFVDSPIGEVPDGWRVTRIQEVCDLGRGSSPRPIHDYMGGTVPWIKIADATSAGGRFIYETKEFVTERGATKSVWVNPGDLILSNSATCGVPIFVGLRGCIHDGWLHFRDLRGISRGYLFHLLATISEHLVHIADGSVQKNLNTALVGDQMLTIPPSRILAAFDLLNDSIFGKVDKTIQQSRNLAALRDALLPKLIAGELRIADAEKIVGRTV